MAKYYTIEILDNLEHRTPADLNSAKPGDHIHFKGPEMFKVTVKGKSPFRRKTIDQCHPCTGPLTVPLNKGKTYMLLIRQGKKGGPPTGPPHPIPIGGGT